MVMDTIQVRLSKGLIRQIDHCIKSELYSSRSDVIRDAVRRLILDELVGILPDKKDSVKEIRALRARLSKKFDLKEINRLAE